MATPTTASGSTQPAPSSKTLVATGDWTKNLVHLAKTAELKYASNMSIEPEKIIDLFSHRKHALTLQLHTAHILSAHESLEQKSKAIQDLKEQKNKLRIRFPSPPPRFSPGRASPWTPGMPIFVARSLIFYFPLSPRLESERNKLLNALREARIFYARFSESQPS